LLLQAQWLVVTLPLPELLRSHFDTSPGVVEEAIFGTTDPDAMASIVTTAAAEIGVNVSAGEFCTVSSGCVVGLRLTDGGIVVLKAYQSHWEEAFLRAVQAAQRTASDAGYPCPAPLAGPTPLGNGWAMLESYLPDPGPSAATSTGAMTASSTGLASLMECLQEAPRQGFEAEPFRTDEGELYPTPHSPIFDFPGSAGGAEWIDEWAQRATAIRNAADLPRLLAHLDWSANNVRWADGIVTAVYDWDSIAITSAAVAAGQAAAVWHSTGESPDVDGPEANEVHRYIDAFAQARDSAFSAEEHEVACASALWVMAYTARCEHALEQTTAWRRYWARRWLRDQAPLLL
jgi:Ser/Thr protein kinase RdoA (MazF antagonist)